MQHINSLPCLVLCLIFSRLPLYDLLQVGRVCALWKEYQMDITRKVHSITLLIGTETETHRFPSDLPYYQTPLDLIAQSPFTLPHSTELLNDQGSPLFAQPQPISSLTLPYLSKSIMNQLVAYLPNVRTLNIFIGYIPINVLVHVNYLLNHWKDQLVTLKLLCYFSYAQSFKDIEPMLVQKLFESINSLSTLEHVTLYLSNMLMMKCTSLNYSFLSRIREFNCNLRIDAYTPVTPDWLTQYGNSSQLQRIGLYGADYRHAPGTIVNQLASAPFARKITVLPHIYLRASEQTLDCFKSFSCLTTFDLELVPCSRVTIPFASVLKSLSSLKQLIHFSFSLSVGWLTEFNRISRHTLTQLPSLKLLSLDASRSNQHTDHLESPHWDWIFPNVQILSVRHSCIKPFGRFEPIRCPHLDRFCNTASPVPAEVMIEGLRVLLDTFKQCPSLRRIYLTDPLQEYNDRIVSAKFNFVL